MSIKSSKRGQVPPFVVMDVMKSASDLEQQGKTIMHLEVGQPSTGIPQSIAEPLKHLIGRESLGYTVAQGIPELRERIALHYRQTYDVEVPAERIFITTGSSAGFQLALLAAFDIGDRVALASPGYPAYRHIVSSLGLAPELVQVGPETRYQPTVNLLETLSDEIDGLIIASPSNPTGTVIPDQQFEDLLEYCNGRGIRLISDEIYHGITYGMDARTAAGSVYPNIVINSFSKYFSMTGWRIGWMVVPADLERTVECLAQNHYISPPTLSQWAALYVFGASDELNANISRYAQNRTILLSGLPKAGITKLAPSDGAFYLYADVKDLTSDTAQFCRALLEEAGVAVTPGHDFDPNRGHETLRISFAGSTQDMHDAVRRIQNWLPTIQR